jgi:hypothetical protein
MDPTAWNKATLPKTEAVGGPLHGTHPALKAYAPERDINEMLDGALAIHALHNNPRIAAQRGVFVVFGREKASMEQIFETRTFPDPTLTRIGFPRGVLEAVYRDLRLLGFRESMIYPDLSGLGDEIRINFSLP